MIIVARRVAGNRGRARAIRCAALLGTAIGCSWSLPASAEKVVFNGSGNFSATRSDTLTDTAQVVDVRTTTGNILLDFANLQAASATNGSALFANVTTAGTIGVTTGMVNVTGANSTNGVNISGTNGNINLVAGTTTANTNNNDRAINVTSPAGNITITSTRAVGSLRGISTSDGTGAALPTGTTTINSGIATANGTGQVNAIVAQGATVIVNSGTASLTNASGNGGGAIFVQAGAGGATIKSTAVNLSGVNQAGIQANLSDNGSVNVDSGTITATQSATGINTDTTGGGGTSTIKSGTISLASNSTGIQVDAGSGATSVDSGTITGSGTFDTGIVVNAGTGATSIRSDTIAFSAAGGNGISVTGGETGSGAITIVSNKINSTSQAIESYFTGGTNGALTVSSNTITGTGSGISLNNDGAISLTSGTIALTTTAAGVNSLQGLGITAVASGTAAATITSGSIVYTGTGNTFGIQLQAVGGGTGTINSGTVSVIGNGGYGINGVSTTGALTIVSTGDVTTTGTTRYVTGVVNAANARYADGIDALSDTGAITVSSAGTISTSGATARGIDVEAGRARNNFGTPSGAISTAAISVTNTGTVKTTGATSNAINILADNNIVTLTSANVSTTGANSAGINVSSNAGAITVATGNVTTTGANSDAVHIVSASGPITVNVTGALSAANGTGLFIDPPAAVNVTIASGASAKGSVAGLSTVGATNNIVNLGTVSTSGTGAAIVATGITTVDNSGVIAAGSGGVAVQLGATNDSVILRNGSAVTGTIAGGGGTDAAILAGTSAAASSSQTVATFTGFDRLTVQSGYWTAPASGGSAFNSATIASGASLENVNGATGLAGVTAPTIIDNGTLVVRSSSASAGSTFGATQITGSGAVLLTGAGTVRLDGVNSLANTGATTIDGGTTAIITGTQGGNFATTPTGTLQVGAGGTTGVFTGSLANNGTLVVNRSDDYVFTGAVSGAGTINKSGSGKLTFGTNFAFTGTTNILAGSIKLSTPVAATTELAVEGAGQLDLSGTTQVVAELAGVSSAASVNIAGGALTVNQATSTSFAGNLTGNGSLTKTGAGRLNLTGVDTYTGPTTVSGGTLSVNGSIVSPTTVTSGGTLGGTGNVASVTIGSGGTYAPGNSIGTQTVNGNVVFQAGSTFAVEANAAGQADRINATGTATLAGAVRVLPDATGTYANLTSYTILTAAGGVSGTFTGTSSSLAYLTPLLSYGANAVTLTLARNDVSFASIAADANQASVGAAVQSRGLGNTLYNYTLGLSAAGARTAFTALAGEIHASLPTALLVEGQEVGRAVLSRASTTGDGVGVWGQAMYGLVESASRQGVASSRTDRRGGIAGIDIGHDGLRFGAAGGYLVSDMGLRGRASHADIDTKLLTAYASWSRDAVMLAGGVSYSWHDVSTRRSVNVGTIGGLQVAKYDADTAQIFGTASYGVTRGAATFAPFLGYSHLRTHRDGFAETGSAVALTVASSTRSIDVLQAGAKMYGTAPLGSATLLPHVAISYQRYWGNTLGIENANFGGTGTGFSIVGARTGKDALRVEGGSDIRFGDAFRLGASAFGQTSGAIGEYGARASISYSF
ncbi:autotransporter domain-containing protein [Sphingomonas sp. BIUV-7]|uniref:Autotransporter domain-containing protein n=1 Tax=Sphingomonas natans TaxID=3063330 RepID=A0ABT8YBC6_9SPHN|nr:autotransporter domain-containing protein [Sphingomonas sp. BIUV-7]MDO6414945.1 autotransporter domain-containing protein [Sphingomonas sp. BIUV-7]